MDGIRFITKVSAQCLQEISDCDSDYNLFCQYVETPLEHDTESIRQYLCKTLLVDSRRSHCHRIPIDGHEEAILIPYPSILTEEAQKRHKEVTKAFDDMELADTFYFAGSSGDGTEPLNTYPVVYAGFTEDGDMLGVYAIRIDT